LENNEHNSISTKEKESCEASLGDGCVNEVCDETLSNPPIVKEEIQLSKPMGEKQIVRFMAHYQAIVSLSQSSIDENVVAMMKLKLNNMQNFKYKHDLTEEQLQLMNRGRDLIKEVKDKLG